MASIELNQKLPSHPKIKRLTRTLGFEVPKDIPQAIGHVCMFWLWCYEYAGNNGSLAGMDAQDIADAAGWTGDPTVFANAMVEHRFIDMDEDGIMWVHNWQRNIGRLIDSRDKERERNRVKQQRRRDRERAAKAAGDPEPAAEAKTEFGLDPEWVKIVKCYESNIGMIPCGRSGDMLVSYMEDLSADVVCKAIEVTNEANPSNPWQYLKKILDKWVDQNINTVEKAEAYNLDLKRRIEAGKKQKQSLDAEGPPSVPKVFY